MTLEKAKFRRNLEATLIYNYIYNGGFGQTKNILSHKNFVNPKLATIYQVCEQLYPNQVINVFSVQNQLKGGFSELLETLPDLGIFLHEMSLQELALILVQIDLSEKFLHFIAAKKEYLERHFEYEKAGVIAEIYQECLNQDVDILLLIDNAATYYKNTFPDDHDLETFKEHFFEKIRQIKSFTQFNQVSNELYRLAQINKKTDLVQACNKLASAMLQITKTQSIPSHIQQALTFL